MPRSIPPRACLIFHKRPITTCSIFHRRRTRPIIPGAPERTCFPAQRQRPLRHIRRPLTVPGRKTVTASIENCGSRPPRCASAGRCCIARPGRPVRRGSRRRPGSRPLFSLLGRRVNGSGRIRFISPHSAGCCPVVRAAGGRAPMPPNTFASRHRVSSQKAASRKPARRERRKMFAQLGRTGQEQAGSPPRARQDRTAPRAARMPTAHLARKRASRAMPPPMFTPEATTDRVASSDRRAAYADNARGASADRTKSRHRLCAFN